MDFDVIFFMFCIQYSCLIFYLINQTLDKQNKHTIGHKQHNHDIDWLYSLCKINLLTIKIMINQKQMIFFNFIVNRLKCTNFPLISGMLMFMFLFQKVVNVSKVRSR